MPAVVRSTFAVSAVVVSVLAGCGGGDGGDRLSRDEFVAQASEICNRFETRIEAIPAPRATAEVPEYVDKARPAFEEGLEDLRELNPPEDLQDRYDDLLATGDTTLDRFDELRNAAEDGDEAEVNRIVEQVEREDEESDRIARELGLAACAEE